MFCSVSTGLCIYNRNTPANTNCLVRNVQRRAVFTVLELFRKASEI